MGRRLCTCGYAPWAGCPAALAPAVYPRHEKDGFTPKSAHYRPTPCCAHSKQAPGQAQDSRVAWEPGGQGSMPVRAQAWVAAHPPWGACGGQPVRDSLIVDFLSPAPSVLPGIKQDNVKKIKKSRCCHCSRSPGSSQTWQAAPALFGSGLYTPHRRQKPLLIFSMKAVVSHTRHWLPHEELGEHGCRHRSPRRAAPGRADPRRADPCRRAPRSCERARSHPQ